MISPAHRWSPTVDQGQTHSVTTTKWVWGAKLQLAGCWCSDYRSPEAHQATGEEWKQDKCAAHSIPSCGFHFEQTKIYGCCGTDSASGWALSMCNHPGAVISSFFMQHLPFYRHLNESCVWWITKKTSCIIRVRELPARVKYVTCGNLLPHNMCSCAKWKRVDKCDNQFLQGTSAAT